MLKKINMSVAFLAMACLLLASAQPGEALAARQTKQTKSQKIAVTGSVVDSHGKAVAGARVHFAHHHKHHAPAAAANPNNAKQQKPHKAHHHGVKTQANGSFTLHAKHAGVHHLVAHKKGAGRGHAKVTVGGKQSGSVVIHLHKHHHSHSKTTK